IRAAGGPEALRQANSREWMERLRGEFRDDVRRDRDTTDLFGVVLAACRPDTGFRALDREFAVNRKAMLDVEARAAELAHPRGHFDRVAEPDRCDEIGARVDPRDADDDEGAGRRLGVPPEPRLD